MNDPGPMERIKKKTRREVLWNREDCMQYIGSITEPASLSDVVKYFTIVKEGNDAVRKKELPILTAADKEEKRRSRRYDRDFYRTCVSEGLRDVCYRFLLPPYRAGVMLQEIVTHDHFEFTTRMPGDQDSGPGKWTAPIIGDDLSPEEFSAKLMNSGELVVLSNGKEAGSDDPLRGCRYVAAMELAHEPRVRMYLRKLYKQYAVLTTRPTKKGIEEIDAFHEDYGIHLIKAKPLKDHFPASDDEIKELQANHTTLKAKDSVLIDLKKREEESCTQYLKILKAEQSGTISVHVHLPLVEYHEDWYKQFNRDFHDRDKQQSEALMSHLKRVYLPPEGDSDVWNNERMKVLKDALFKFLLPQFELEMRRELRLAASKTGIKLAGSSLRGMAMEGPYRPTPILYSTNRFLEPTGNLSLVGICVGVDGKDASYLAYVNADGEQEDYLAVPAGTKIDSDTSGALDMKNEDSMREKVIRFLVQNRPNAVLVGTSGGFQSRMTVRKIQDILQEATHRWSIRNIQGEDEDDEAFEVRRSSLVKGGFYDESLDDDEEEWTCNVDLLDDSIPQLFGRSVRGSKEFPDFGTNLKIAISIARFAKNPLAEITYAWNVASDAGMFGTEMLFLNIHPLQRLLPKTQLLKEFERVLTETTSDVGCDINKSCTHDHLRGLLTFVPGFGPRKAAHVKQVMSQTSSIISKRRELLERRFLGPTVYNNAIAFLRIQGVDPDDFHPLDDTRLHPDIYLRNNWAVKIAFDALEREYTSNEDAVRKVFRDVMSNAAAEVWRMFDATKKEWEITWGKNVVFSVKDWDPRKLPEDAWKDAVADLDLEGYGDMIQKGKLGKWYKQFEMIKWEFRLPFVDARDPMEQLHGDRLFTLISGETDHSMRPGKEVVGKVVQNGEFGSRVKLEGDIPAFIPLRNMKDEHVETAESVLTVGQIVHAVVTEVKKDHMTVDLSLKREDRYKIPSAWERPSSLGGFDNHFDKVSADKVEREADLKRQAYLESLDLKDSVSRGNKRAGRVVRRACTHPAFRNARNEEVDKELTEGGLAMVGEALIRPSSKNCDSLALHWVVRYGVIKVIEIEEEDKETDASIGNILRVRGEKYGSIDELLGRFVAPLNDHVEELTNHRKFVDMEEDKLGNNLEEEKQKKGNIPYALTFSDAHPGYAALLFVLNTSKRCHYISIEPNGFRWFQTTFSSLDRLIGAFKKDPTGGKTKQMAQGKSNSSATVISNLPVAAAPSQEPQAPRTEQGITVLRSNPPYQGTASGGWTGPVNQNEMPPTVPPVRNFRATNPGLLAQLNTSHNGIPIHYPPQAPGGGSFRGAPKVDTRAPVTAPIENQLGFPVHQPSHQHQAGQPTSWVPNPQPPPPPPQRPAPPPPPAGRLPRPQEPAFQTGDNSTSMGRGRGRDRTLPSWMAKGN